MKKYVSMMCGVLFMAGCMSLPKESSTHSEIAEKRQAQTQEVELHGVSPEELNAAIISADSGVQQSVGKVLGEIHEEVPIVPEVEVKHQYSYQVRGKSYNVLASGENFKQMGIASWYGPRFHGKLTASGERYDMNKMTAAHKTLPIGAWVEVTNLSNHLKVVVRINDRGPFHSGRIIDVSKAAAKQLGIFRRGSGRVHIKTVKGK